MTPTLILSILTLLIALTTCVAGLRGKPAHVRLGINAAWGALVLGFGGIYVEQVFGLGGVLCCSALGALAVLPADFKSGGEGARAGHGLGGMPALALSAGALIASANTFYEPIIKDPNLILMAGAGAALGAALGAMLCATMLAAHWHTQRARHGVLGPAVVIAALALGALLLGSMRADLPGWEYMIPLTSEGKPVRWALPGVTAGSRGFGFTVTLEVLGALELTLLASLFVGAAGLIRQARQRAVAFGLGALGALGALLSVLGTGLTPRLPLAQPYFEHARTLAATRDVPERILVMGGFERADSVYVLWLDILPDCMALGGAALLATGAAYLLARPAGFHSAPAASSAAPVRVTPADAQGIMRLWARDLTLRAVSMAWLGWILTRFLDWRTHAIYGFASPQEWALLGAVIFMSGAACFAWQERSPWQSILYGLACAALILATLIHLL